jgi:hypothetical protein
LFNLFASEDRHIVSDYSLRGSIHRKVVPLQSVYNNLTSSSLLKSHACCVGSWGKRALLYVEMVTGRLWKYSWPELSNQFTLILEWILRVFRA